MCPTVHRLNATAKRTLLASFIEIVRRTSCELPADVRKVIEGTKSPNLVMDTIRDNLRLAKSKSQPICQDTGTLLFYVQVPDGMDQDQVARLVQTAAGAAIKMGYLRQNAIETLSGKSLGARLGPGTLNLHLTPWRRSYLDVRLILKGGGSENVGIQYSLPDSKLHADRDLAGVETCLLDAVWQAQGKGCSPGVLGVAIGGDRASGFAYSKKQFLRKLDDHAKSPALRRLEDGTLGRANQLGIGPMGLGGAPTLLGVKIGALDRLPASFFVSVSYMCWAFRRQGARVAPSGEILKWLY